MSTAAFSTPTPPKPPTLAEIQAMMPGLKLYNPSDQWLPLHVHGLTHRVMPPDLGGAIEPHPLTGEPTVCNGIYEVKGRFLTQKDSSGKTIEGQDAFAVVQFVIHKDRYGEMGVVYLPGVSESQDEQYKQLAKDLYLKYREGLDDKIIEARREFKNNWERNPRHQGTPCPPPTPPELAAIERAQERTSRKAYAFECHVPECPGYAQNDWSKFARHMLAAHKIQASRGANGKITMINSEGDVLHLGGGSEPKATGGRSFPVSDEDGSGQPSVAEAAIELTRRTSGRKRSKGD
jgi:hypothetical protein